MPRGNSELIQRIESARDLLNVALSILSKGQDGATSSRKSAPARTVRGEAGQLSFAPNPRAFMKKHGRGLSGSKKFTLLLARFVKGKVGEQASVDKLVSEWNRMKGVMDGAYNPAHATRAKEQGWIDSPKKGVYVLSESWKEVVS